MSFWVLDNENYNMVNISSYFWQLEGEGVDPLLPFLLEICKRLLLESLGGSRVGDRVQDCQFEVLQRPVVGHCGQKQVKNRILKAQQAAPVRAEAHWEAQSQQDGRN